jgi:hypothetical protein
MKNRLKGVQIKNSLTDSPYLFRKLLSWAKVKKTQKSYIKKWVAYPQEDFLFTILQGTPESIELAGWIQNPKKILAHQIYWSKPKISKKNCVSYLKSEKRPKICPTEFAGPTQNSKKIIRTSNQPIRTKSMFSTLKVFSTLKGAKI